MIAALNDSRSPAASDKSAPMIYWRFDWAVSEWDLEPLAFVVAGGETALAWHWKLWVEGLAAIGGQLQL